MLILCLDVFGQTISGRVTCQGKGLKDIVVSNGYSVTSSDAKGRYSLPIRKGNAFVFISIPSGYQITVENGTPLFYHQIQENKEKGYDFELMPLESSDNKHAFLLHADAQLLKDKEFTMYEKAIDDCRQLVNQHPLKETFFGIDCGDLVADKHSIYPQYISTLNQLEIPFFRVIGNHDLDYNNRSNDKSSASYESFFGPSYYSFNRGKAHYVVLNDVFYLGHQYFYIGYLEEEMLNWLEKDLAHVPEGSLVFVALHIPTAIKTGSKAFDYASLGKGISNRLALYKILEPYKAHILSGHEHCNQNLQHKENIYEHICASVSGAWWQGPVCTDGTPCGYQVFEVEDDSVSWYYKSIGYEKDYQFKLYPVGYDANLPDEFIVNIWNWGPGWTVEWYEDGVNKGEMTQYQGYDPDVAKIYADKDKLDYKWIGPSKTTHLFKAQPAKANAVIEVRVTDSFGTTYMATLNSK
ncbi:calcineurin-like phosphoesterase C-terminal domain-containing protein [Carboxylicivirga taeanensis]|uniref:calcineurin-like phosphoesterase C-terminal domain-containing protein n=1 Tax=Carboxylicivirga taeanensis TaxID=1416875 RepID=UPI003F6E3642